MNPGYTIRIFVPDGDPEGVRVVDRMNWTGRCHVVPRAKWMQARARWNFRRAGLYVLIGFEEDDLPTIYVGKSDDLHTRIDQHDKDAGKSFWDRCIVFTSSASDLNATHAAWLEWQLVKMAAAAGRARLANGNAPAEPNLSEAERADMEAFLEEVLRILPLVDVRAFERGKPVIPRKAAAARTAESGKAAPPDTIVVPAKEEGFERVFLGENCWYAIRISAAIAPHLRFIVAYRTQPVSAITHLAEIERIEPYGTEGKYRVVFHGPAAALETPIPFGDAAPGAMQGPRYTSRARLRAARTVGDLTRG